MQKGSFRQDVLFLPVSAISPAPDRPRKSYSGAEMTLLADSVRLYGVLQPLTVQRQGRGWILVTGERRLRAAKMAGLREVPCLPVDGGSTPSLTSLLEFLRRRDLHYIEEARGVARLTTEYGLSQQAAAHRLGKSQSAIANKLRLLRHPPEILSRLQECPLTERHARALLQVPDTARRLQLLERAETEGWTVAQLEAALTH